LQDLVSSGGQTVELGILKDVNGVLKPVSCKQQQQQLPQTSDSASGLISNRNCLEPYDARCLLDVSI
jgi:hypothetical protein